MAGHSPLHDVLAGAGVGREILPLLLRRRVNSMQRLDARLGEDEAVRGAALGLIHGDQPERERLPQLFRDVRGEVSAQFRCAGREMVRGDVLGGQGTAL